MAGRDALTRIALAAGLAWLAAEALLALALRIEGYDGYWYLSNAWYLAGGPVSRYEVTKGPLLSLIYLPLAALRRLGMAEVLMFAGAHLLSLALTALLAWLVARLLRPRFGAGLAWAGAVAFAGSRLVSRYAVFAMADLPAALGVLLALMAVVAARERDGWRARLPLAGAVALAVMARYVSGLVLPVAVAWDVWGRLAAGGPRAALRRLGSHVAGGLLAGAGVLAVHLAVYMVPFGSPARAVAGMTDMVWRNARLGGITVRGLEPWWEYGPMLAAAFTLPGVLLMAAGIWAVLRHGDGTARLHLLWAAAHLGFVSLVSSHKEARYMLPAIPSLVLLLLWGLRQVGRLPPLRSLPHRHAMAGGLLLAIGLVGSAREAVVLGQPFFRDPSARRLAEEIDRQAPAPARLAWFGNFYPQVPPRHIFDRRDEYYYVYHLGPHVLEYYMGRPVQALAEVGGAVLDGVLYPIGAAPLLETGDGLLSSVPEVTVTANLDQPPPPLYLCMVEAWELAADSDGPPGRLRASRDPVTLRPEAGGVALQGFPGPSEVLVRQRSGLSASLGLTAVEQGRALLELPAGWQPASVHSARVLRYRPRPLPRPW